MREHLGTSTSKQATRTAGIGRNSREITLHNGDLSNHPVGVAMETIANTTWGLVWRSLVLVSSESVPPRRSPLATILVVTSIGTFLEDATSVTATSVIHALALERRSPRVAVPRLHQGMVARLELRSWRQALVILGTPFSVGWGARARRRAPCFSMTEQQQQIPERTKYKLDPPMTNQDPRTG